MQRKIVVSLRRFCVARWVTSDGIFQRLALVRALNANVVLGANKNEALLLYKRLLMSDPNSDDPVAQVDMKTTSGMIDRYGCVVAGGETTCSFTLVGDSHIYTVAPSVAVEVAIARSGDMVSIGFMETEESSVPLDMFDLILSEDREKPSLQTEKVEH